MYNIYNIQYKKHTHMHIIVYENTYSGMRARSLSALSLLCLSLTEAGQAQAGRSYQCTSTNCIII